MHTDTREQTQAHMHMLTQTHTHTHTHMVNTAYIVLIIAHVPLANIMEIPEYSPLCWKNHCVH